MTCRYNFKLSTYYTNMFIPSTHPQNMSIKLENLNIMKIDITKAYNELPVLPPQQDIETKKILKVCIEARASLAELRKAAEMLPNQSVLINSLLVRSSSKLRD